MRTNITLALATSVMLLMSGCGGGGGGQAADTTPKADSALSKQFDVQICTSETKTDPKCQEAVQFDLDKHNVLVLGAPEDIGSSQYLSYGGKRFGLVPKEEMEITPVNMLAYGLTLLLKEQSKLMTGGNNPIPGIDIIIKKLPAISYEDVKDLLHKEFKLTGTKAQNNAILAILNHGLDLLGAEGLDLDKAVYADIKAMAEELVNLTAKGTIPDLSGLEPIYKDGIIAGAHHKDWIELLSHSPGTGITQASFLLGLTKHQAAMLAYEKRKEEHSLKTYEEAIDALHCEENEFKHIYMYGQADGFDTSNTENTTPRTALSPYLASYSNAGMVHPYDYAADSKHFNVFAETLTGLHAQMSSAVMVIGVKATGVRFGPNTVYPDTYTIGNDLTLVSANNAHGMFTDITSDWDSYGDHIYSKDMSQMSTPSGDSILTKIQSGQSSLDVRLLPTTNVDFIAIASCEKKDKPDTGTPIKEITDTLRDKFTCNAEKGESYLEVIGGTMDDFTLPVDVSTPSTTMNIPGRITYDEIIEKTGNFTDTLALPGTQITKAQLMLNHRISTHGTALNIAAAGDGNNQQYVPFDLNQGTPTLNGGHASLINSDSSPALLGILNSGISGLDILAQSTLEVDTTLLQLCVTKKEPCVDTDGDGVCDDQDCAPDNPEISEGCKPDENGTDDNSTDTNTSEPLDPELPKSCNSPIQLDLSLSSTWSDASGTHPTVNNVFSTYPPHPAWANVIWDGNMTWFDFGAASNTEHELSVDFCACGGGTVTIEQMKSDNYGYIYLDNANSGMIVQRQVHSQSTMASWGTDVNGNVNIPYTGNGTNHTLTFKVKNFSGPSGGSVKGLLDFVGHLGKCTEEDTVPVIDTNMTDPGENNGTGDNGTDDNGTVGLNTPPEAMDFNMTIDVQERNISTSWFSASSAFDADGDILTATVLSQGILGVCSITGNQLTYHKNIEDNATDSCELSISDGTDSMVIIVTIKSLYWQQVSAGQIISAAIKSDGTLWTWGHASYFLGRTGNPRIPRQESTLSHDWHKVRAGRHFFVAIKEDGTLWTWGQPGPWLGRHGNPGVPMQESTLASDWTGISSGIRWTSAIKNNGSLWSFGINSPKTFAANTPYASYTPIQEATQSNDWLHIKSGVANSVGIKSDGTLWSWGANQYGQIGDGTASSPHITPTQESTAATSWVTMDTRTYKSVAIQSNGTLWTWGYGYLSRTGNPKIPMMESTQATDWVSAQTGSRITAALKSDHTLWTMGSAYPLALGRTGNPTLFAQEQSLSSDWSSISVGHSHMLAIKENGTLWAWGMNGGVLGDNSNTPSAFPKQIMVRNP